MYRHELNLNHKALVEREYPHGTRVRCIHMQDSNPVPANTCGTVVHIDDIAQIHVAWDNGSTLALIPGVDRFEKL